MLSPPPRHRSTSQGRGQGGGLSVILPHLACVLLPAASFRLLRSPLFALISFARSCLTFCQPFCPPLPLCQVVMGRADHQPGQAIPSRSSCRPSPPLPGPRHIGGHPGGRGGGRSAYLVRRGSSVRFKVSGISARLYRSKYQLFIFSEGFIRAKPVHRGNGNCT